MRATAARLLHPYAAPDAFPPAGEVDTLTATLRGHLQLLVPEVAQTVGPRPWSVQTYCAMACVGEARRKLSVTPKPRLESRYFYARRLARVLDALCDHYEKLRGAAS